MFYGIIPIRGGSKRLPRKNIIDFCGKSLTARCIETALKSGIFAEVFVSTDNIELAEEAKKYGAKVPFIRPKELAGDFASSIDVLMHALDNIVNLQNMKKPDTVCLMQVTSPFNKPTHLIEAKNLFIDNSYTSLSSVMETDQYYEWQYIKDENNKFKPADPEGFTKPSALLPKRFIENGAMYFTKYDYLVKNKSLYDFKNHGACIMSKLSSIDIDTMEDFIMAKAIEKEMQRKLF